MVESALGFIEMEFPPRFEMLDERFLRTRFLGD